jgi:hypothetical protein
MRFSLYPFQKDAVEANLRSLDANGASLEATGCGGGKTIIACEVARRYGLPVGVVCPKSVKAKWQATLEAFGIEPVFVENPEKLRAGNTPWVKKSGKDFKWTPETLLLVVDEVHMFAGYKSTNSKMLEAAPYRTLMLSATAAESPLRMKAIGSKLGLFHPRAFWGWVRNMGAENGRWGGLEWDPKTTHNKLRMEYLHYSIFTTRGNRTPDEVLADQLPELRLCDEPIHLSSEDRDEILKLYSEMIDIEDPAAVKNLRQRQAIELIKVPYLVERAKEIVEEGGSVVLFLNFHESIDKAAALLGEMSETIDGRVSQELRQGSRDRFQANVLRCLVVQIGAGGQSIDLHDTHGNAPRTALLCPQFSGTAEEQAIGRVRRVGAKNRALALRLYAPGTVEQAALHLTRHKRENQQILNEGIMTQETNRDIAEVSNAAAPTNHEERAHAEHSPSSLKEKAKCPGFRNDNARDTTAADRGTLGHLAIEKENLDVIPADDEFLRKCAGLCLQYLRQLREKCGAGLEEIRERRYIVLDQFGHIDHIMLHGDTAELVDYKFAWGKYEADSPQFWAYSIGIWDAHPQINKITVHVLLPFQGVIDVVEWTRDADYDRLVTQVTAIIAAARRNDPASYMTGGHCSWCNNRAECPKLNSLALTIASKYQPEELALPPEYDPAIITDPEKMALAKKLAPILKDWSEKVNARALELRLSGVEIPGYELKEKKSSFKITDPQAAWEVVKNKITPEAFAACAEVKIGELEKAVARTADRGQMAKAKAALRDALIDANAAKQDGTISYLEKSKNF